MKRFKYTFDFLLVLGALSIFTAAQAQNDPVFINSDAVAWGECPPSLPAGCEFAVIAGDPSESSFVFRIKVPDGWESPAHIHPVTANVTVISGTFNIGVGEVLDRTQGTPLSAGGYHLLPIGTPHFAWADGETVVQVHSDGPWGTTYVDPATDPRNQ